MSDRKELFDGWAASYDASLEDAAGYPFEGYQRVLEGVVDGAGVGGGTVDTTRVLDLGTGTGALAARFAALGCRVLGVDLSDGMLEQARIRVPDAEFRQLDLLGAWDALAHRRFDAVVSAYVLHEFVPETRLELLSRLSALLEPSGRVVIGDISFETAQARDAARRTWQAVWDEGEHPWVAEDAVPALERLGFGVAYHQVSFCAGVYTLQARPAT